MNIDHTVIPADQFGERLSGPQQAQLVTLLSGPNHPADTGAGTIERPAVSDRHILDAIAHLYELLPQYHLLWGDPRQVAMIALELPTCDDCCNADAQFEVPSAPGRWAMALCRGCALQRVAIGVSDPRAFSSW